MNPTLPLLLLLCVAAPAATFNADIAPIIYSRCTRCHRPGETAPFPLTNYAEISKRASLIAAVTASRYMPPWKAGPASYPYKDNPSLTPQQIEIIQTWVRQGAPRGDPARTPPAPKFPEGWQLGTPDLIVQLPEPLAIPADGPDLFRRAVIPLNLSASHWLRAIELRPSSQGAVHHVIFFADTAPEAHTGPQPAMRFTRGMVPLGGIAIGAQPHLLPEGLAIQLPQGSDLVFQYHLHPTGKPQTEQSKIGLYFEPTPPAHTLTAIQLPPVFGLFSGIKIPARKTLRIRDSYVLPVDVEAVSTGAHAHYRGKSMTLTATLPDGRVKTLLSITDWDFSWQDRYFFEGPVTLPKGTRLECEIAWDNSASNPRNPANPPLDVQWGEQSKDEMGSVNLQVYPRAESDLPTLHADYRRHVASLARSRLAADPALRAWVAARFGAAFTNPR